MYLPFWQGFLAKPSVERFNIFHPVGICRGLVSESLKSHPSVCKLPFQPPNNAQQQPDARRAWFALLFVRLAPPLTLAGTALRFCQFNYLLSSWVSLLKPLRLTTSEDGAVTLLQSQALCTKLTSHWYCSILSINSMLEVTHMSRFKQAFLISRLCGCRCCCFCCCPRCFEDEFLCLIAVVDSWNK